MEAAKSTLKVLDVGLCDISENAAYAIAKCTELHDLQLQGCPTPSANAIAAILASCGKLMRVGLSGCVVTDESAARMITNPTVKLHTVQFAGCRITDKTVELLCKYHANTLRILDIRHTDGAFTECQINVNYLLTYRLNY